MNTDSTGKPDPIRGLRGFLILDAGVRLLIWSISLAISAIILSRWTGSGGLIGGSAWAWSRHLVGFVVVFNLVYGGLLVLLRLPIPQPREGRYRVGPGGKLPRDLIWSCLIATLTKARYEAPFPGFLVFHAMNLPPLVWVASRVFGPHSRSCYVAEPQIIDPHMVTIGRNVVIGFGSIIAGHFQEQDEIVIAKTIIEDDVLIGAGTMLSGSTVKKGAVVGAGSVVMPGSVIGEGEYWSGNPARRRFVKKEGEAGDSRA